MFLSKKEQQQSEDSAFCFEVRRAFQDITQPALDEGGKRFRRGDPAWLPLGDRPDEGRELEALKTRIVGHMRGCPESEACRPELQKYYARAVERQQGLPRPAPG